METYGAFGFKVQGSDTNILHPAGIDPCERLKGKIHVQGNSMEGDTAPNGNADKTHLSIANPYAGIPMIPGG